MNSGPIKTAGKYAVCSAGCLFLVVLLTLVFNFLGNLSCALLTGMMMKVARPRKWLLLLSSLVFPAVIFAVLRPGRTELLEWQVILISPLCWGAFWLSYGLTAALTVYERNAAAATPSPAGEAQAEPSPEPSLAQLEGNWCSEAAAQDGRIWRKQLEIKESNLVLRVADARGQPRLVARAKVKLENSGSPHSLVIAVAPKVSGAHS